MHFSKSLLAAAVSAAPALAFEVNTYWGQVGVGDTLGEYCESSSIDYVTLAFVNNSPENGNGTHYPGTNFAAHCASDVYVVEGRNSKLLSGCSFIKDDIKKCKGLGKKILLSIGGEMNSISNYTVSTVEEGEYFAKFMFDAFGPYQQGSNGPRPFDISDTEHTFVDGFDFDIEYKFENQDPYIAMIQKLRLLTIGCGEDIILTAAPQCPLSEEYMQMKDILEGVAFDKIWIQFYNNPVCDATGSGFNYADWVQYLSGTVNFDAELFVGLPATKGSSGYITPDAAKTLICNTRSSDKFGGIMLWDAYSASQNVNQDGKTYYECIHEALHGCCPGETCTSTSSSYTMSATTSSSSSASSSTVSTTSSSSASSSTVSTTSSSMTTASASSTASSSSASSSATTYSVSSSTTSSYSASSTSSPVSSSATTYSVSSSTTSSYRASSTSSSDDDDYCTDDDSSSSYTMSATSSISITRGSSSSSYVITTSSAFPISTSSASATLSSPSSSSASYTVSQSVSKSASESAPLSGTSSSSPHTTSSSSEEYTTSTVRTTISYTVTSCAPTITNCPGVGGVVTETIDLYTTVCPVTETQKPTDVPLTTSTIYSTRVATVTKCPPSVTNCPIGSATTEIIAVSTTICPVTETEKTKPVATATATYPAGGPGSETEKTKPAAYTTYPAGGSGSGSETEKTKPVASATTYPAGGSGSGSETEKTKPAASATYPVGGSGSGSSGTVTKPTAVPTYPAGGSGSSGSSSSVGAYAGGKDYPSILTTVTIPVYATGKSNSTIAATATGHGASPTNSYSATTTACSGAGCAPAASKTAVTAGSAKTAAFSLGGLVLAMALAL